MSDSQQSVVLDDILAIGADAKGRTHRDHSYDLAKCDGMVQTELRVTKQSPHLQPDPRRVIARPYIPSGRGHVQGIVQRVLSLSDTEVTAQLTRLHTDFASRHRDIEGVWKRNFQEVQNAIDTPIHTSPKRCLLIGACGSQEYSLESVALFNPSMVVHPDQEDVADGSVRFIMSLRACGEGHISSIEFRSGMIDATHRVSIDAISPYAIIERPVADKLYDRKRFFRKLLEMGQHSLIVDQVLHSLDEQFTMDDLKKTIDQVRRAQGHISTFHHLSESMLWLARSNYHLNFPLDSSLSERVIFPVSENESRGIEDARFVRFVNDDGSIVYYGVYTAYNGLSTLPQFIETTDFLHFKIYTLNGKYVQNKGMALFPRKIGSDYVMVGRIDGENLYLLRSDNVHFWNHAVQMRTPVEPWEFVQIGNCGSPIETDEGWLLLTHGVGPMRRYCIGALLLDLNDPSRVIGWMSSPILVPEEKERDGYVPNVVYSCGAILHNGTLILPYAYSDTASRITTLSLSALLKGLTRT